MDIQNIDFGCVVLTTRPYPLMRISPNTKKSKTLVSPPLENISTFDSDISSENDSTSSPSNLTVKERRAANQRRYYQRNKLDQQVKARARAGRKKRAQTTISSSALPSSTSEQTPSPPSTTNVGPDAVNFPIIFMPPSLSAMALPQRAALSTSPCPLGALALPQHSSTAPAPISEGLCTVVITTPDDIRADWATWSARQRMSGIRRWMLDVEWQAGGFDRWASQFMDEWTHNSANLDRMAVSLEVYGERVKMGRLMVGYLGRVMDGNLSGDLEECRDLSLQIHQLAALIYSAVAGLESSLGWARLLGK